MLNPILSLQPVSSKASKYWVWALSTPVSAPTAKGALIRLPLATHNSKYCKMAG